MNSGSALTPVNDQSLLDAADMMMEMANELCSIINHQHGMVFGERPSDPAAGITKTECWSEEKQRQYNHTRARLGDSTRAFNEMVNKMGLPR